MSGRDVTGRVMGRNRMLACDCMGRLVAPVHPKKVVGSCKGDKTHGKRRRVCLKSGIIACVLWYSMYSCMIIVKCLGHWSICDLRMAAMAA